MTTLVLTADAPLQSWGLESRHEKRETHTHPTKSGIIGLLNAASGIGRGHVSPFNDLRISVRADRPGRRRVDYHTTGGGYAEHRHRKIDGGRKGPGSQLSDRWYLEEATFTVFVSGDADLIKQATTGLQNPFWQISLGRRSCPPATPVLLGVSNSSTEDLCKRVPILDIPPKKPKQVAFFYETALNQGRIRPDQPTNINRQYQVRGEGSSTILIDPTNFAGRGPQAWERRRQSL